MRAVLPWVLLILVAWFGGCQYQQNRDSERELAALLERNADLEDAAGRVDTVYQRDTLTLTRVRRVTDSVLLTDSLFLLDTVYLRPRFMGLVEAERAACTEALRTCEQRVALRDSIIANLDSVIRVQKKRGGNWKTKLGYLLGGAAAGVLITK